VLSHHETVEECRELVKTIKRQNVRDILNRAASVKPAGPQPMMRTSTCCGNGPEAPDPTSRLAGSAIVGPPGSHPVS
jgi:hypothetical protein